MRISYINDRDQLSFIILRRGVCMQLMFFLKSDELVVWRSRIFISGVFQSTNPLS